MAERKVFHVVKDGAQWKVKPEGGSRASSVHRTKDAAVDAARGRAKSAPLGQVIIHKQDGTIQTEHTYGKDPYPPKG